MCQGRHPPPPPRHCWRRVNIAQIRRMKMAHFAPWSGPAERCERTLPLPKNADAVPAPAAAFLPRISGILHDPSGPPPVVTIATIPCGRPPTPCLRERCAATADRGPDGYRGKLAFLGRAVAAGEGTASAFFQGRMVATRQGVRRCTSSTRSRSVEAGPGRKAVNRPGGGLPSCRQATLPAGTVDPSVARKELCGFRICPRCIGDRGNENVMSACADRSGTGECRPALPWNDRLVRGTGFSPSPAQGRH